MRSHFLKELPIAGKEAILEEIPEFDFYNVRRVVKITWVDENSAEAHRTIINVTLDATYDDRKTRIVSPIEIRCSGVKQMKLPDLGSPFWPSEIEIEEITHEQNENVRFRVKDFGGTSFEVLCAGIELAIH
jgi:hypothetical protein